MFPCTSYTANTLHMGWREGGSVGWSEQREGGEGVRQRGGRERGGGGGGGGERETEIDTNRTQPH